MEYRQKNHFTTQIQQLDDLGFSMLADWLQEKEIDLNGSLRHLESNKYMMDNEEDEKAFERAEEIVQKIFPAIPK